MRAEEKGTRGGPRPLPELYAGLTGSGLTHNTRGGRKTEPVQCTAWRGALSASNRPYWLLRIAGDVRRPNITDAGA